MAKNKIKKIVKVKDEEMDMKYRTLIITFAVMILLCIFVYYLTDRMIQKEKTADTASSEKEYNNSIILLGNAFSVESKEYYVLIYDFEDKFYDFYDEVIQGYPDAYKVQLYLSNLSDGMNKPYIGDKSNPKPTKLSELKVSGPTLIKFVDGKIDKYIEGDSKIKYELNERKPV